MPNRHANLRTTRGGAGCGSPYHSLGLTHPHSRCCPCQEQPNALVVSQGSRFTASLRSTGFATARIASAVQVAPSEYPRTSKSPTLSAPRARSWFTPSITPHRTTIKIATSVQPVALPSTGTTQRCLNWSASQRVASARVPRANLSCLSHTQSAIPGSAYLTPGARFLSEA